MLRLSYGLIPVIVSFTHFFAILWIFHFPAIGFAAICWAVFLYHSRALATTVIYHRLLAHESFKAPKWFTYIGAVIACSAGQMGPIRWVARHIDHHKVSDQTQDLHSPTHFEGFRGFLWAQGGWVFSREFFFEDYTVPKHLRGDSFLKWLDAFHWVPVVGLASFSYLIGGMEFLGAYFLSSTALFHGIALVNSVCHLYGDQPFDSRDQSRHSWWVAILTWGEGWHNSHHKCPKSALHGITQHGGKLRYLPDPTFWFILLLERLGLA